MKYKIIENILTKEECEELINRDHDWIYDPVINNDGYEHPREHGELIRKVLQSSIEHIFPEWDGLKVLGTKVMKYEVGDFVKEHRDRMGMLHSDCYEKGYDLRSKDLMIIPLNDDYEGGALTVEGEEVTQTVGNVVQVKQPGNDPDLRAMHGVSEVTKGTRYSLVFWNFQ